MEELLCSNDSEEDADSSDEFSKEREDELYSVLHYNDFSQGIPPELLEKYCISTDRNNEFVISFKNSSEEQPKLGSDSDDGSKPMVEHSEEKKGMKKKRGKKELLKGISSRAKSPSDSSSDEDVVVVEFESSPKIKGPAPCGTSLNQNQNGDSADFKSKLEFTSNPKMDVVHQQEFISSPVVTEKSDDLPPKSSSKSEKTKRKDVVDGKLTPSTNKKTNSSTELTLVRNPKKRKLEDNMESTLAPIHKEKNSNETKIIRNVGKERNLKGTESKVVPDPEKEKPTDDTKFDPVRTDGNQDAFESKMAPSPKSRVSNKVKEPSSSSLKNSSMEVVVEEHSDSDDSSCVVVEDPECNRKISLSSTESVIVLNEEIEEVALLSSEDEESGFSLNTTEDIAYNSDGNVSDVIETSNFHWEEVASPKGWTKEMRKYYNSSCERLRYFDHTKIRQQIKTGSRRDWMISPKDLFPNNRPKQRCLICRQSDHMARNCPKKDPPCHMCGTEGHSNTNCPHSICLQCGKRNRQFTSVCRSCTHMLSRECFNCKQTGHESKACPEKWREFHSTTEGPLKRDTNCYDGNRTQQCCNCGKTNHTFEECNQQYMSSFAKSHPAYNWLFGRSGEYDNWRGGFSGVSPRNTFEPPFKRRKHHHDRDSFSDGMPRWTHITPVSRPKKKKKKPKRGRKIFLP